MRPDSRRGGGRRERELTIGSERTSRAQGNEGGRAEASPKEARQVVVSARQTGSRGRGSRCAVGGCSISAGHACSSSYFAAKIRHLNQSAEFLFLPPVSSGRFYETSAFSVNGHIIHEGTSDKGADTVRLRENSRVTAETEGAKVSE
ncbi:Hypothetical protein SMAX5B_022186 [Scophthalmus maximus]|uniref:Uncharacterized protein n=1 Tax=Scophthalmus maximus TaxID=52904 RepID=A0A2U9B7C3_SCOMX|nr:Hypothetical protein SMAX5B_022186 [Scophthalmus maximus]